MLCPDHHPFPLTPLSPRMPCPARGLFPHTMLSFQLPVYDDPSEYVQLPTPSRLLALKLPVYDSFRADSLPSPFHCNPQARPRQSVSRMR